MRVKKRSLELLIFFFACFALETNIKVQAESFHLNGHIIGLRLQTQKLDSPYKTPSNTPAVKGLRTDHVVSDGVGSGD